MVHVQSLLALVLVESSTCTVLLCDRSVQPSMILAGQSQHERVLARTFFLGGGVSLNAMAITIIIRRILRKEKRILVLISLYNVIVEQIHCTFALIF